MKFCHKPNQQLIEVSKIYSEKKYLSVTKLTGKESEQAIIDWRKRVGDEVADKIMKQSSKRGTNIHNFIENYLSNEEIMVPESAIENYYTFKSMKPELNKIDNIVGLEVPVYSDEYRLRGRFDCLAEYNGELSMIDFKTSKKVKKKAWITPYFIQATAYTEMIKEHTDLNIKNIVLIFGITDYNLCKVEIEKPQNFIKELNRINNEYNI